VTVAFLAAAHLSMALGGGSTADPLGYAVVARRKRDPNPPPPTGAELARPHAAIDAPAAPP
jgi:hypothetical protein